MYLPPAMTWQKVQCLSLHWSCSFPSVQLHAIIPYQQHWTYLNKHGDKWNSSKEIEKFMNIQVAETAMKILRKLTLNACAFIIITQLYFCIPRHEHYRTKWCMFLGSGCKKNTTKVLVTCSNLMHISAFSFWIC